MQLTLISNLMAEPVLIAGASASLGVIFHLSTISREIDSASGSLLITFFLVWAGLVITFLSHLSLSMLTAILRASLACFCFLLALSLSTVAHRVFFHRLRRFPGPLGARISRFWTVRLIKRSDIKYHVELEKLHQTYGDFVRTGPREISINRASAVPVIHGPRSPCTKGPWFSQVSDDSSKINVVTVRNPEVHRLRRRAWDRGLGTKALSSYQPKIQRKVDILIQQLHKRQNQSIDITQWTAYYTFDVMGEIAFSRDFKQLDDAAEHFAIKAMHAQMEDIGLLGAVPWLMHLLTCIPGLDGPYEIFKKYTVEQIERRKAEWQEDTVKKPTDVISWLLKAIDDHDPSAPPSDSALYDEGRLAIIGGSDTTGAALAHALFFLATHPESYKRLQNDVDEAEKLQNTSSQLPYLEAIMTETLRLKPSVPSGNSRVTPPEGLVIDEVRIPGDTIVIIPQYVVQRDERNYVRPLEFLPERWLEEGKDLVLDGRAFFPFTIGPYTCAGKQLAYLQMRMALRHIAREFDISLAPGEDPGRFDAGARDTFTMAVPPLRMIFKKRPVSN